MKTGHKAVMVPERIRTSLLNKSRKNRIFFDSLCVLIWCECKEGCSTKSKSWEEWADIELQYFGTSKGAIVDKELVAAFNTPRKVLTAKELDAIQNFINTHTFTDPTQAQMELSRDLFNDCVACALNILERGKPSSQEPLDTMQKQQGRKKKKEEKRQLTLFTN